VEYELRIRKSKYIINLILKSIKGEVIMDRVERIKRSLRARNRRKVIRKLNRRLYRRYCLRKKSLRKKYNKIRNRHHTREL
jgi:hypothetical protein